jgi:glutamate-1-semialdehyde 2,1-aminomutase
VERVGARLRDGLAEIAARRGGGILVQGLPAVFNVSFNPLPQTFDHAGSARADAAALRRFIPYLLARGVRIATRGAFMLSSEHSDADVDRTLEAFDGALAAFRAVPA